MVLQDLLQVTAAKRREQINQIGKVHLLPCCVDGDKGGQLLSVNQLLIQPTMLNGRCKGGADEREIESYAAGIHRRQEDPVCKIKKRKAYRQGGRIRYQP
jgi:hypothetical protein